MPHKNTHMYTQVRTYLHTDTIGTYQSNKHSFHCFIQRVSKNAKQGFRTFCCVSLFMEHRIEHSITFYICIFTHYLHYILYITFLFLVDRFLYIIQQKFQSLSLSLSPTPPLSHRNHMPVYTLDARRDTLTQVH